MESYLKRWGLPNLTKVHTLCRELQRAYCCPDEDTHEIDVGWLSAREKELLAEQMRAFLVREHTKELPSKEQIRKLARWGLLGALLHRSNAVRYATQLDDLSSLEEGFSSALAELLKEPTDWNMPFSPAPEDLMPSGQAYQLTDDLLQVVANTTSRNDLFGRRYLSFIQQSVAKGSAHFEGFTKTIQSNMLKLAYTDDRVMFNKLALLLEKHHLSTEGFVAPLVFHRPNLATWFAERLVDLELVLEFGKKKHEQAGSEPEVN
jgi:hypothetical protein